VLKAIRAGEKARANHLLEPGSAFTRTQDETRTLLVGLRGKAAEA
jgi:hypothetical protein